MNLYKKNTNLANTFPTFYLQAAHGFKIRLPKLAVKTFSGGGGGGDSRVIIQLPPPPSPGTYHKSTLPP